MYEKDEEKSKNVGVTIDIPELAKIHCHKENSSSFSNMFVYVFITTPVIR